MWRFNWHRIFPQWHHTSPPNRVADAAATYVAVVQPRQRSTVKVRRRNWHFSTHKENHNPNRKWSRRNRNLLPFSNREATMPHAWRHSLTAHNTKINYTKGRAGKRTESYTKRIHQGGILLICTRPTEPNQIIVLFFRCSFLFCFILASFIMSDVLTTLRESRSKPYK